MKKLIKILAITFFPILGFSQIEQCNNGFDDDGDGLVDCYDGDCANSISCANFFTNGTQPPCPDTPNVALFSMKEQYRTANNVGHGYTTPVVGDMDGDGMPEIVVVSNIGKKIYVINGQTGTTITSIAYQQTWHQFSGGLSIADIDNDGTAEVFVVTGNAASGFDNNNSRQYLSCYDYVGGTLSFRYRMSFGQNNRSEYDGQKYAVPQFVDFDQDGTTEIFIGNHVMNASTGAIIASPTTAQRYSWPRGRYYSAVGDDDYMSAAYDILPDGFCTNCSGVEIIAGNTVYAVDLSNPTNAQNGITVAAQMTPTGTYKDGLTSLADWDGDGLMDIIVVGRNGAAGAYVYVWNPRTQTIINGPVDIQAGGARAGRATVADFDGDGTNELAIVSQNRLHVFEPNLSIKWSAVVADGSANTSATAFDFEGDGNMEVVYRDQNSLYILDGLTGAVKTSLQCGSGTRVEMPIIADVDADGEAEIICGCTNQNGGGGTATTRVFTSDQTPWMPTRKVWNSLHYAPTFINDDLTIPAVRQHKTLIPNLDIYAAQAHITDPNGNIIFPALPDFVPTIDSTTIGICTDDSITVYLSICNDDASVLKYNYPVSYYDGDPTAGGTLIGTRTVTQSNTIFTKDSCYQFTFKVPNQQIDLHVYVNDEGTGTAGYPTTNILECDSSNNNTSKSISICITDLEATKTDSLPTYNRSANTVYTIVAKNNGPNDVQNATVSDPIPNGVNNFSWTATLFGTASNTSGVSGSGAIADNVNLAVGDSIVYTVTAAVSGSKYGDLKNTVTIVTPAGTVDTDSTNNTATDVDIDPDPTHCFIMKSDFEDYVNCPLANSYDDFTAAYSGNSAWVNSNLTAGLFVNDIGTGGSCNNIHTAAPAAHADGGTAYAGLHSPLSGLANRQEVIIGTLPSKLYANQQYEISFIGISIQVRNQAKWNNYGKVDFFGIADGTSPVLDATTQSNWTTISAIPEVDHLGTSATISSRTQWNKYSFKFTPTRDLDRLLLAPRGDWAYVGIDNIVVKVAAQTLAVDTLTICAGVTDTVLPYSITSGNPTHFAIDWDAAANTAGISDVAQTTLPTDSQFVLSGLASFPAGIYKAEITVYNTQLGCETEDSIYLVIDPCIIDASITKDDGQLSYIPGGPLTYTIVAKNLGPDFIGGVVSDPLPTGVGSGDVSWTAVTFGGASTKAIGTMNGALQDTVDIPDGDSVVYTVTIATPPTLIGDLVNTVTITVTGDTILTNNTATDIDTVDCTFSISGIVNSKTAAWQEIGTVRSGSTYNINTSAGFKTFTATNGPESGNVINSVIYNTGSNNHVSLTKNKYNPSNNWLATVGTYDNTPHAWTGLSGVAPENAPVLGFMAFVDQNGDGIFNSGIEEYIRDINTLSVIPTTTGQLYMAFYDDGPYNDNNGIMTIKASVNAASVSIGNDTTICEGNSVTLDAENPGSTYLWNTSATTQTIQSASTGQYTVAVNTGGGCLVRDTINVIVDTIIVTLGTDTSLCAGDSVLLDAGNIGANYLWSTGETTQTIQAKTAMQYSVAATVANGCIGRDTIVISQIPMLNLGLGNDTAICVGESINFTFTKPIGSSQIWNTGSTMQTISADSAAAYSVLVTDSNGCLNHDTIVLSLNPLPIVNLGNDTTICSGTSITLTPQNTGSTYLWNDGSSVQSLIASAVGKYFVEETNSLGCIGKDTIEILALDSLPLVDLGPDSIMICSGASIALDGGSTGSSYLWQDASTNQTFNTSTLGKYFVQVKNGNNCIASDTLEINAFFPLPPVNIGNDTSICIGTSVTLDAGPASSWAWLPSGNTSTITASLAGTYSVEISDSNGCIGRDTILISNDTLPAITLGNDTSICEGDTVDLVTVLGLTSYLWTNNSSTTNIAKVFTTNTYEVTGTDLNGCENTASIDVTVNPLPVIGLADSSNYCVYGQNLIISVFESGATYLWNNGLATQQIPISSVGTYWVDVTDVNNCFETDTIVITSDYLTINLGPDQTVCEKDSILLDAGNYPLEIWNLTDTASTYNVYGTEKVSVIAIDADGCFGVDTIMITQTLNPTIDVVKTDSTICDLIGEETSVYVINPQGMSVSWNTGETGQNIPVAKIGTYVATLTNGDNCSASDSAFIDRSCDTVPFTMPNVFTPNIDGINDDFVPIEDPVTLKDYFKSIDFIVYNRWGRTVYLSSDVLPLWNGKNIETGNMCSVGVYFWVIEYKDIYGKIERINGFVHLAN